MRITRGVELGAKDAVGLKFERCQFSDAIHASQAPALQHFSLPGAILHLRPLHKMVQSLDFI
jgi:hypothetical protein